MQYTSSIVILEHKSLFVDGIGFCFSNDYIEQNDLILRLISKKIVQLLVNNVSHCSKGMQNDCYNNNISKRNKSY